MQKLLHMKTIVQPGGEVKIASPEFEAGQTVDVVVPHESRVKGRSIVEISTMARSPDSSRKPKKGTRTWRERKRHETDNSSSWSALVFPRKLTSQPNQFSGRGADQIGVDAFSCLRSGPLLDLSSPRKPLSSQRRSLPVPRDGRVELHRNCFGRVRLQICSESRIGSQQSCCMLPTLPERLIRLLIWRKIH